MAMLKQPHARLFERMLASALAAEQFASTCSLDLRHLLAEKLANISPKSGKIGLHNSGL
jgi:hypothetical protein